MATSCTSQTYLYDVSDAYDALSKAANIDWGRSYVTLSDGYLSHGGINIGHGRAKLISFNKYSNNASAIVPAGTEVVLHSYVLVMNDPVSRLFSPVFQIVSGTGQGALFYIFASGAKQKIVSLDLVLKDPPFRGNFYLEAADMQHFALMDNTAE